MIITLKGANFGLSNIGTLSTWTISKVLGSGATYSGVTYVNKDASFRATVTISDGYELGAAGVTVTMGGTAMPSSAIAISGNTITITISSVTGNIVIRVPTVNVNIDEEEEGGNTGGDSGGDSGEPTPPASGETVSLTSNAATVASTTEIVSTSQTIGQSIVYQEAGTRGILAWDIPAYAEVTLEVKGGGNYGIAICDANDIVLEYFSNGSIAPEAGSTGTYTFGLQMIPTKLYVSTTKFNSGSYTTYTGDDLVGMELPVRISQTTKGQYISTGQTIGSPVQLSTLSSGSYSVSDIIPANVSVKITCKETSAGGYGMALCDTAGNVLEYIKHTDTAATNNEYTFKTQNIETKLYVSVNKFVKAVYIFQ